MLQIENAFASFAVDDVDVAREFYAEVLGMEVAAGPMGVIELTVADGSKVLVYPKGEQHDPATFTVLNIPVDDIERAVGHLTALGVEFEHYDGEIATDEKGIMRGNGPTIAWFRDPAGNIMSLIEETPQ